MLRIISTTSVTHCCSQVFAQTICTELSGPVHYSYRHSRHGGGHTAIWGGNKNILVDRAPTAHVWLNKLQNVFSCAWGGGSKIKSPCICSWKNWRNFHARLNQYVVWIPQLGEQGPHLSWKGSESIAKEISKNDQKSCNYFPRFWIHNPCSIFLAFTHDDNLPVLVMKTVSS